MACRAHGRISNTSAMRIRGGTDDVSLVMNVLAEGPLCSGCLAKRTGIPKLEIPSLIERVRETVRVHRPRVHCVVCHRRRMVYRVREPGASDFRVMLVALGNARLCMACLVGRTGVPTPKVHEMLTALGQVLTVRWSAGTCEGCSARAAMVLLP
jgi:hypothetical protein